MVTFALNSARDFTFPWFAPAPRFERWRRDPMAAFGEGASPASAWRPLFRGLAVNVFGVGIGICACVVHHTIGMIGRRMPNQPNCPTLIALSF